MTLAGYTSLIARFLAVIVSRASGLDGARRVVYVFRDRVGVRVIFKSEGTVAPYQGKCCFWFAPEIICI